MIKFITANDECRIEKIAAEALKHRLFIPGWQMHDWLYAPSYIEQVTVCKIRNKPVGIGVRLYKPWSKYELQIDAGVFVKSKYRRRGIGSKIYKILAKSNSKKIKVAYGNTSSISLLNRLQHEGVKLNIVPPLVHSIQASDTKKK